MRKETHTFPEFFLGLDLGQLADFTALTIATVHHEDIAIVPGLEPKRLPVYNVSHLQRWQLNTPYPQIVRDLKEIMARPEIAPFKKKLLVDFTGANCLNVVWDLIGKVPEVIDRLVHLLISKTKIVFFAFFEVRRQIVV